MQWLANLHEGLTFRRLGLLIFLRVSLLVPWLPIFVRVSLFGALVCYNLREGLAFWCFDLLIFVQVSIFGFGLLIFVQVSLFGGLACYSL